MGIAFVLVVFLTTSADAARVVLADGDFADASWSVLDDDGVVFDVGRFPTDGNPGAYRRLHVTEGAGGQADIVNVSPQFRYDPATHGPITGLSIAFDVIRPDAAGNELVVGVGTLHGSDYSQLFVGSSGSSWQHYQFECIDLADLPSGPVQLVFAFSGFTPFTPLSPPWDIGIDNFVVQIETAPDTCDGLGPALRLDGTDGDHLWKDDPVIPYAITVGNDGGETLPDVRVSEQVPVKTTFVPAESTGTWTCEDDGVCVASVGDLAPGESKSLIFAAAVHDDTPRAWSVYNEIEASGGANATISAAGSGNSCVTICTESDKDDACTGDDFNLIACCALKFACGRIPGLPEGLCDEVCAPSCIGGAPGPVAPAGVEPIRFQNLYRLRDRVFAARPGGERATALYYQHTGALVEAFAANPAIGLQGLETLQRWQPAVVALLDGTSATVTAEQRDALLAFLAALRPVASPALAAAIDHGRRRLGLDDWDGLALTTAVERLDALVCTSAPTYPSVICRLEDADELAIAGVPAGKLATKLTTSLDRAVTAAGEAADLTATGDTRVARRRARTGGKLVQKVVRRANSRAGRQAIPEATRAALVELLAGIRVDLKSLSH